MRRMITQKQAESLDKLNAVISPNTVWGGIDIASGEYGYSAIQFPEVDPDDGLSMYIGFDDTECPSIVLSDDESAIANGGIRINTTSIGYSPAMNKEAQDEIYVEYDEDDNHYKIKSNESIDIDSNATATIEASEINLKVGDSYADFYGSSNTIEISCNDETIITISPNGLKVAGLPTSDPHVRNRLWNDSGTLKISLG